LDSDSAFLVKDSSFRENLEWHRSGVVNCERDKHYGHGTYFADDTLHLQ
jgi:hypothetical protein